MTPEFVSKIQSISLSQVLPVPANAGHLAAGLWLGRLPPAPGFRQAAAGRQRQAGSWQAVWQAGSLTYVAWQTWPGRRAQACMARQAGMARQAWPGRHGQADVACQADVQTWPARQT